MIGFLALMPFVVPPIVLVVGLLNMSGAPSWFYAEPYGFLVGAYVILAFPYMFFSLDAGFRVDRRAHADRGVAEPRRQLADDARAGDPAEHPRGCARRRRSSRSRS